MKTLFTIFLFLFVSNAGYAQDKVMKDSTQIDTVQYKLLQKVNVNKHTFNPMIKARQHQYKIVPKRLYRPTRLGSSSPLYNTYKKNDSGAGAVTTNPHKSGKSFIYKLPANDIDSLKTEVKDSISVKKY